MTEKKVYMVMCDDWDCVTCFGIYTTQEKAYARHDEIAPYHRDAYVEEIDLDDDINWTI